VILRKIYFYVIVTQYDQDMNINKYTVSDNEAEGEILPNLLSLNTLEEISESEFLGFIHAEQKAINALSDNTMFDVSYLYKLHKDALGHLYSFEKEFLSILKDEIIEDTIFIKNLARMHTEFLFVHPFREWNGRTIRIFTNLIYFSKTGKELDFKISRT
jgi:cell filamentation protein